MKFNIGRLGVELLLSWNQVETIPPGPTPTPIPIPVPIPIPGPITPPTPSIPIIPSDPPILTAAGVTKAVQDTIFKITSAFEGGKYGAINYSNLSGNFDGQGYSIGFLQWCVGQGSDLPLFQKMKDSHDNVLRTSLGELYNEFVSNMAKPLSQRLSWAINSVNTNSYSIESNWRSAFTKLCSTKEFQNVQDLYAGKILSKAVELCKEYGVKSVRGLMLMFDIITQNGSIRSETKTAIFETKQSKERSLQRALKEKEFLEIIAIKRAEAAKPEWVYDVKSRKLAIVYGKGTVHGDSYNLDNLGLSDNSFTP